MSLEKKEDYNPEDYHPLFITSTHIEPYLEHGTVCAKEVWRVFRSVGITLSWNARISVETKGSRWLIVDGDNNRGYAIRKKNGNLAVYENLHVINQIVDRDLCVRCGACEPACPVDIIRFNERGFPYITNDQLCITTCTRCLKVCPGEFVNFSQLDDQMFGCRPHPESITGIAKRALVSYATDDMVRRNGASGGFVTQILAYMFDRSLIDGALVLGTSSANGGWHQQGFIARSAEEVKRAAKSKYLVTPFLRALGEIEEVEGSYAVVSLPCYIHAVRKYQRISRKLRSNIKVVIGLYCNAVLEAELFDDLCQFNGIRKEHITEFHFRHGEWPGGIIAECADGTKKKMLKLEDWKDEFNTLKLFYTAPRCNTCIDLCAEYADLAVGDPWLRGADGKYLFEDGRSTVLVRTEIGDDVVRKAVKDGYIHVKEIPLKAFMMTFETIGRYKRDFVPKTILMRKLLGLPVPEYNRTIGNGQLRGYVSILFRHSVRWLARFRWFRRLGLCLAQTRAGIAYFAWNRRRKERKFAAKYRTIEGFVEEISNRTDSRTNANVTCNGPRE